LVGKVNQRKAWYREENGKGRKGIMVVDKGIFVTIFLKKGGSGTRRHGAICALARIQGCDGQHGKRSIKVGRGKTINCRGTEFWGKRNRKKNEPTGRGK